MLCRDVYHCLPSQLRAEPLKNIAPHLTVMTAESEIEARNAQKQKGRRHA